MPYYPGAREEYEGLPVAFLKPEEGGVAGEGAGRGWGRSSPSMATVTPKWLAAVEARLGPLAADQALIRRRLSAGHWAGRVRSKLRY